MFGGRFQAIVCNSCEKRHFDVHDTTTGGIVEETGADEHGSWESGFGETPDEAKADAVAAYEFRSSLNDAL
jgi:hypothetical protein